MCVVPDLGLQDNCNYDSFERQLERMLTPLFARAGVKLEVRNAGEGTATSTSFGLIVVEHWEVGWWGGLSVVCCGVVRGSVVGEVGCGR